MTQVQAGMPLNSSVTNRPRPAHKVKLYIGRPAPLGLPILLLHQPGLAFGVTSPAAAARPNAHAHALTPDARDRLKAMQVAVMDP